MNSKIAVAVALAALLAAILVPISAPKPAFAATVSVDITSGASSKTDTAFSPNPVKANVGDTVTWTNKDSTPHTVTSGSNATPDQKFDSSPGLKTLIATQATFSHTFTEAGDYPYYCQLHPAMVGMVTVAGGGGGGPQETKVTATLDGKNYDITVKSATSKGTTATIKASESVTIAFDKAGDVQLTLPKAMITGVNSVMAGNQELLKGQPTVNADGSTTVNVTIPNGATTVVIKGATVVPEFPVVAAAMLAGSIAAIIGYTRFAKGGSAFFGKA